MALVPQGQREQLMVLVMVIAVALVGGYWFVVYSPTSDEFVEQRSRLERLNTVNHQAKSELAKGSVSDLQAQLAEYQRNLALVRTLVPTSNEVPALLEQVSNAARRVGLDLAAVDPQPVIEGETYDTHRYNMAVLGGYHELAAFLTNVGSLTRILLPVNLTLQMPSNPNAARNRQRGEAAVVEARFQLQAYVAREQPLDDRPPRRSGAD
jgi:type IV pilus assembly protein PilO